MPYWLGEILGVINRSSCKAYDVNTIAVNAQNVLSHRTDTHGVTRDILPPHNGYCIIVLYY